MAHEDESEPEIDLPLVVNEIFLEDEVSTDEVDVTIVPQPEDQLRKWTLIGLFGLIVLSLAAILAGLGAHWFDGDFAKTIIQSVVSPILGALAAIIGYLFAERRR